MMRVARLTVLLLTSLMLAGACDQAPTAAKPRGLHALERLTETAAIERLRPTATGFAAQLGGPSARDGFRSAARPLRIDLPATSDGTVWVHVGSNAVAVRRRGAGAAVGQLDAGVLRYRDARIEVVAFAKQHAFEELFVASGPTSLGYDLSLPEGWSATSIDDHVVELRDAAEQAQLRIAADRAWDAEGNDVAVALRVDEAGLAIELGDVAVWPVVVDPTFIDASVPSKLRQRHTTTLLTDGRVLIAGGEVGGQPDASAEIYDPVTGTTTVIANMTGVRSAHSATVLQNGRVLIAGGAGANGNLDSSELFDPATEAFVPGPTLSVSRLGHSATRLADGKVLLAGGNDQSADIVDAGGTTVTATGVLPTAFTVVAAALLDNGEVLFLGNDGGGSATTRFDPTANSGVGAFSATTAGPASFGPGGSTLTLLRDGRVLGLGGCPCSSVGGATFSEPAAELYDPGAGTWAPTGGQNQARSGHTATLLPNGNVLVTGGNDSADPAEEQSSEIYNVVSGQFTQLTTMIARHRGHTATLLPSGEVLIFGGTEAAFEIYAGGVRGSWLLTDNTTAGRSDHEMTLLTSGEVLVTGSGAIGFPGPATDVAELFDPATNQFSDTGALTVERQRHAAVLLQDGDVLVTGGSGLATAEIYNRSAQTFTATGSMQQARDNHAMVTLPGGDVLVVGGAGNSAERFDPSAGTFTATATPMTSDRAETGAALLPNGKALIVSDTTAELYDPTTDSFTAVQSPGASYQTPHIVVMQTGEALVTGSYTQSAEIFDPASNSFRFTGADAVGRAYTELLMLPNGIAMEVGGENLAAERTVYGQAALFHPLGNSGLGVVDQGATAIGRTRFGAVVLLDGDVLVSGGIPCLDICLGPPSPAERWSIVGDPTWRPTITTAPTQVVAGSLVSLTGTAFTGPEAAGGRSNASESNYPVVTWQPLNQGAAIAGTIESWTATTADWRVPATAYYGRGWLRITVSGVPSVAELVEIQVAPDATGCAHDAECASGFCTDGVCCDARCGERCEACTAELKGDGADGVCGPVPPERDPDDDCVLSPGAPCEDAVQCDTGFCVDGLCCDGVCADQCEACDVEGSEGQCVPVTGPPRGGRAACDASPPDDLCDTGVCDGVDRTMCSGTIGPCDPYACTMDGCLDSCSTDDDCATGHHCQDGVCLTGQCNGTTAITPEGQEIECAPYICQADGTCRTSCADVKDCAEPFGCDFAGRCVQRPPNDVPSDCACRALGTSRAPSRAGWLVGVLLFGLFIRRRRGPSRLLTAAAVSIVVLLSASGHAQQPEETPATVEPSDKPEEATPEPAAPAVDADEAATKQRKEKAREHFHKGVGLYDRGAWRPALAEFLQSRELYPTRVATENAAVCHERLERYHDALSMYETLLRDFDNLSPEVQSAAQRAIIRLRKLVGTIEIDDAEVGAAIVVDGTNRGTYPPPSPLRAAAGSHIVRVYKEGYEPFEQRVEVAGGATARVHAKLAALKATGLLKVTEAKGAAIRVLVDNVAMGETPWEGRLSPGDHTVRLAGDDSLGTAPVSALIKAEQTTSLSLEAKLLDATLRIEPTPANAEVVLDAVTLGRGVWEGALPSGPHKVEVVAEGFFAASREVELTKGGHQDVAVELQRDDDADIWSVPGKFTFDLVGAASLVPTFGGDVVASCEGDCSAGVGLGGFAKLSVGYELAGGLGVGVLGGYMAMAQEVDGRETLVQPVGLGTRQGTATDKLMLSGPFVGAYGAYMFDMEYPLLLRLSVGPVFSTVKDERVSSFPVDEGGAYQAGPITQEPTAIFLLIDPEVKINVKLGDNFYLGLGLDIPVLVALQLPTWDGEREIDAAEDGIGAFGSESLTGRVVVGISPNVGLRAHF
jgi:hypothetical protein